MMKLTNRIGHIIIFLTLFLLNGCLLTYYSAHVLQKGKTNVGGGIAGGSSGLLGRIYYFKEEYDGGPFFDNSIYWKRQGIGNRMDAGFKLGIPYLAADIRYQINEETEWIPAVSLSVEAMGLFWIGGGATFIGGGPGLSFQVSKGYVTFTGKYNFIYITGGALFAGSIDSPSSAFIGMLLFGHRPNKKWHIQPLLGVCVLDRYKSLETNRSLYGFLGLSLEIK